jgi:energy-converting hydrogenase Eha subunit E
LRFDWQGIFLVSSGFYVLVLGSVGTMIGMRQIPALGIAIRQLLNIRFVIALTNVFLVFSTFINLTDFVHRAFST